MEPNRLQSLELGELPVSWSADDAILYHLAIGAGGVPTDTGELAYVYERGLKVLPSFAVLPGQPALLALLQRPEFAVDLAKLLHAEQEIELHRPLPPGSQGTTTGRVAHVYDKGSAALVILEAATRDGEGDLLAISRFSIFVRDAGGFGGDAGPPPAAARPEREPDLEIECATLPQQGLLYRLCGDKNPIHVSPEFAATAGFDRPILHGLCTYGIACKAAVDHALDGDVTRVRRYRARFTDVVYPGETIIVRLWREDHRVYITAVARERDAEVLNRAVIDLHH